ncbi:MAG: hypothetical protein EU542_03400 [Promethearchaeota archaeon]|nr:MAG: hypothetical protein EU542_03400 [Candidatus Lokiarchaeota archaeon]
MDKSDYVYMIQDNILVYKITLPPEFQQGNLEEHLNHFTENALEVIAGFNKSLLRHFLKISRGKNQNEIQTDLEKMEQLSYLLSPIGNLNYLGETQVQFILSKLDDLNLKEINENKISLMADDQLRAQFGSSSSYSASDALESQLSSAAFYLMNMGYTRQEIQEKFNEVRQDPAKLESLFSLPEKEIYNIPSEIQQSASGSFSMSQGSSDSGNELQGNNGYEDILAQHIQSIHQEITAERAQKVDEILAMIKAYVKDKLTELQEKVFQQMHPDRLNRALKMLKSTKRKSKRMDLYLEWFVSSLLLSKIELKVEHWQVSSSAGHGDAGVYTAGIDFSRYDNIIRDFPDNKLEKVVKITRRILRNPTKKAIQKLGQDLIAETGFDEHLYFTD